MDRENADLRAALGKSQRAVRRLRRLLLAVSILGFVMLYGGAALGIWYDSPWPVIVGFFGSQAVTNAAQKALKREPS